MQKIKLSMTIFALAILIFTLTLTTGCDGLFPKPPVSAEERLNLFEEELNTSGRENLYLHFHPSDTEMYNQIKAADYFNSGVLAPDNGPFSLELSGALTDDIDGRKIGNGTLTNDLSIEFDMIVTLLASGENWYIEELLLNDGDSDVMDIRLGE